MARDFPAAGASPPLACPDLSHAQVCRHPVPWGYRQLALGRQMPNSYSRAGRWHHCQRDVRRLAAIDMYGTCGTARRRRIILGEVIAGSVAMVAFGVWLTAFSVGSGGRALGAWAIGAGLNYVPLAQRHRADRPGALEAERAGVDTARELRRYSIIPAVDLCAAFARHSRRVRSAVAPARMSNGSQVRRRGGQP